MSSTKLIIPSSIAAQLVGQRASSVAPSLSPEKRYLIDKAKFDHFKSQEIIREAFNEKREAGAFVDGDIPQNSAEAQVGKPLNSNEVEKRLKRLNSDLLFEVSMADEGKVGIYVLDEQAKEKRRFVCGMERGWMPEWTVTRYEIERRLVESFPPKYENFKVYKGEKRGWRKVISRLITMKLISKVGADKVFGSANRFRWHGQTEGY